MTLNQFLKRLGKTPRAWYLRCGAIRMPIGPPTMYQRCCPITSLHPDGPLPPNAWGETARILGLSESTANAIAKEADGFNRNPKLRAKLLKACGLTEQGETK